MITFDALPIEVRAGTRCDCCYFPPAHFRLAIPRGAGHDFRKLKVLMCVRCCADLRDILRRGLRVHQKMGEGSMVENIDANRIQKRA